LEAGRPGAGTLCRVHRREAALAIAQDAVRLALAAEVLADLAQGVVGPPDAGVVVALVAEIRLPERCHRGRAGSPPAHRPELEDAPETRAEQVALDLGGRAQRRVRDAGRIPDEERRVGVGARPVRDRVEDAVHELEQVLQVKQRHRAVARLALGAAGRRLSGRPGAAELPAERTLAGARLAV